MLLRHWESFEEIIGTKLNWAADVMRLHHILECNIPSHKEKVL